MTIIHIFASIWTYSLFTFNWFSFLDVLKPIHVSWLKYYVKNVFDYKNMANILNTVEKIFPPNLVGGLASKLFSSTKRIMVRSESYQDKISWFDHLRFSSTYSLFCKNCYHSVTSQPVFG